MMRFAAATACLAVSGRIGRSTAGTQGFPE
jgi:hypothetical protein